MVKYLSLWLFGNLQKPQEVFFFPQEDLLWKTRVFSLLRVIRFLRGSSCEFAQIPLDST